MKKLISFSFASLVILIPNIALSQPPSQNITQAEKEIIRSFVCSNEDYTRGEVISAINSSNLSVSNSKRNEMADAIMNAQQLPDEAKNAICES
ncbi:MAG: hypothetical protein AB4372_11355 [Xenococcus sp. (in: cyanobacteria)]